MYSEEYKKLHKYKNKNIYITSDEEIKEGVEQWYLDKVTNKPYNSSGAQYSSKQDVIILTTDQDLIKDGVQAIDDEFLEWFVKNPSCEKVEVVYGLFNPMGRQVDPNDLGQNHSKCVWKYKIIIPKEELKQEKKMYSEKDILDAWELGAKEGLPLTREKKEELFEQLKKK
jgi:hypothetical protein